MFFCPICLWLFRCSTVFTLQSYHNRTKPPETTANKFSSTFARAGAQRQSLPSCAEEAFVLHLFPRVLFCFSSKPRSGFMFSQASACNIGVRWRLHYSFFPLLSRHAKTHMLSERGKTTRAVAKRPKEAPRSAHTHSYDGRRLTGVVVSLAKR